MKKLVNIFVTFFVIIIGKGCIIAPVYLIFAPFVTAYRWNGVFRKYFAALRFEFTCVIHCLSDDWYAGCKEFVFNLSTLEK